MPSAGTRWAVATAAVDSFNAAHAMAKMACPPTWVWMPNQPHPTSARITAGTFAPFIPNADLANTGNGTPYLHPACPLSTIGSNTMRFAMAMQAMPWAADMPRSMTDPARVYAGTQTTRPIQSAAMS